MQSSFTLPAACTPIEQERCSARLVFDYITKKVNVKFDAAAIKDTAQTVYDTDTAVRSVINFERDFIQQTVDYSCSTSNSCNLDYVQNIAIPVYSQKNCSTLKFELILTLYTNQTIQRDCFVNDTFASLCTAPCDLLYDNSGRTARGCDGRVDLAFETSIGVSTPVNKPEYRARTYAYGCNTPLCNGLIFQKRVETLLDRDLVQDGCLISLNSTFETTVTSTSTTQRPGQASTFLTASGFTVFLALFFHKLLH